MDEKLPSMYLSIAQYRLSISKDADRRRARRKKTKAKAGWSRGGDSALSLTLFEMCGASSCDAVQRCLKKGAELRHRRGLLGTLARVLSWPHRRRPPLARSRTARTPRTTGLLRCTSRVKVVTFVGLLLAKDVNITQTTNCGWSPLYIACQASHVDVVSLLLEKGRERQNAALRSVLAMPVHGRPGAARERAIVDRATNDGRTPLFACYIHEEIARGKRSSTTARRRCRRRLRRERRPHSPLRCMPGWRRFYHGAQPA